MDDDSVSIEFLCLLVLGKLWRTRIMKAAIAMRWARRNPAKVKANQSRQTPKFSERRREARAATLTKEITEMAAGPEEPFPSLALLYFVMGRLWAKQVGNYRRGSTWRKSHPAKCRAYSRKDYYKDHEHSKKRARDQARQQAEALTPGYVRGQLAKVAPGVYVPRDRLPHDLIHLKREILRAKRELRKGVGDSPVQVA